MKTTMKRRVDTLTRMIAWRLPHRLVMWCGMRIGAHATTAGFGTTVVPELTFMDAMKRWDDTSGGDRRYGGRDRP